SIADLTLSHQQQKEAPSWATHTTGNDPRRFPDGNSEPPLAIAAQWSSLSVSASATTATPNCLLFSRTTRSTSTGSRNTDTKPSRSSECTSRPTQRKCPRCPGCGGTS